MVPWFGLMQVVSMCTLIVIYFGMQKDTKKFWDKVGLGLLVTIIGGLVMVLLNMMGILLTSIAEESIWEKDPPEIVYSIPIKSLKSDNQISGSFILGTGSFSSRKEYYAFVDTERGLKLEDFSYTNTYLVEDSSQNPHYERWDQCYPGPIRKFLWNDDSPLNLNCNTFYRIIVPQDTVYLEYKVE